MRGRYQLKKRKISGQPSVQQYSEPFIGQGESLRHALQRTFASLQEEIANRQATQQKLRDAYKRFIQRQEEYKRIIQQGIPFCQTKKPIVPANIMDIQSSIMGMFQQSNRSVEKTIISRNTQMEEVVSRKVNILKDYAMERLGENDKKQSMNYGHIQKQIKEVIAVSEKILDENDQFRKVIADLRLKNSLLRQEKELLIRQGIDIKKKLKKALRQKIPSQTQQFNQYPQDQQNSQHLQQNQTSFPQSQIEQRQTFSQQINRIQPHNKTLTYFNDSSIQLQKNSHRKGQPQQPRSKTFNHSLNVLNAKRHTQNIQKYAQKTPINKFSRRISTTIQGQSKISQKSKKKYTQGPSIASIDQQASPLRTVAHLQDTLRRQRKRWNQQSHELKQLRLYQQEMDDLMKKVLAKEGSQKRGERIYNLLKQIERRILKSQNPTINSGYHDINELLADFS